MCNRFLFLVLLFSGLLTGCVSTTPYQCEAGAPQAGLGVYNFNMFTNEIVIEGIYQDPYQCKNPQMFPPSCATGKVRLINANRLTTFRVSFTPFMPLIPFGSIPRFIYTTFIPKAGHTYLLSISHSNPGYSYDKLSVVILDKVEVMQNEKMVYVYNKVLSIRREVSPTTGEPLDCEYVRKNANALLSS